MLLNAKQNLLLADCKATVIALAWNGAFKPERQSALL